MKHLLLMIVSSVLSINVYAGGETVYATSTKKTENISLTNVEPGATVIITLTNAWYVKEAKGLRVEVSGVYNEDTYAKDKFGISNESCDILSIRAESEKVVVVLRNASAFTETPGFNGCRFTISTQDNSGYHVNVSAGQMIN